MTKAANLSALGSTVTTAGDISSASTLTLQTNSTTALTINSSQQVGIGTTSPTAKLSLAGANVGLNVVETGSTYSMIFRGNSAAPNIYDLKEPTANRVALSFDTSGQIISLFTAGSVNILYE